MCIVPVPLFGVSDPLAGLLTLLCVDLTRCQLDADVKMNGTKSADTAAMEHEMELLPWPRWCGRPTPVTTSSLPSACTWTLPTVQFDW